jgi:hypothetical protein
MDRHVTLIISFDDVWRATLPERSGNEGWLGVRPRGTGYHVVCPVDAQIARGVMACNRPTDGTPFGGYAGWLYFRCPQYESHEENDTADCAARLAKARETSQALTAWLGRYGIDARVEESRVCGDERVSMRASRPAGARLRVECGCGESWASVGELLRARGVRFCGYVACPDDFRSGEFIFEHACGGLVRVGAAQLARSRRSTRSLAGSHACPGYCRYERSTALCGADCEGAVYRRIARRLADRDAAGGGR